MLSADAGKAGTGTDRQGQPAVQSIFLHKLESFPMFQRNKYTAKWEKFQLLSLTFRKVLRPVQVLCVFFVNFTQTSCVPLQFCHFSIIMW